MKLEIVSPEATLFKGEVTSVSVPGINGEFQMLNDHAAIISVLTIGNIKIVGNNIEISEEFISKFEKVNENTYYLAITSGVLELNNNTINILAN